MGIDIQQGKTRALRLVPDAPMVSPSCSIQTRTGGVLATPTATPHPLSTTVSDAEENTALYLRLASVTGLAVGDTLRVTDEQFGYASAVVAAIGIDVSQMSTLSLEYALDGAPFLGGGYLLPADYSGQAFVRFIEALPAVPNAGAAVVGLDVTLTVPVEATAALAMDNIVMISTSSEEVTELYNVVAHVYRGPCKARDVRDHIARLYAGEYANNSIGDNDWHWHARVADEVNRNLRGRLLESSAYMSRYWDPDALAESGRIMLRLVLADKGYWTGDGDREDQLRSLRLELKERIGGILAGAQAYDADNDGTIDDTELDGSTTIRGLR